MARMIPERLPDYIQADPLRSAERKVYESLSRQLPRQYTVYYSRPWMGLTADGREIDGEADFVVAHPDHGVLTLEVKGGAISHNARDGSWCSRDRYGLRHVIKNPVEQARRSKHELLRKLKERTALQHHFIPIRHGVVLPDSSRPASDLGADMPLRIFAFEEDLERLGRWVEERMSTIENGLPSNGRFGSEGVEELDRLLARSFQLHTPLARVVESDEQQIISLTEEQYQVLDGFETHKRLAIAGGAGTGKTLLALEKARRLAAGGLNVLLTCYNRPLADFLREAAPEADNLTIATFHELCFSVSRQAGLPNAGEGLDGPGNRVARHQFFDVALPEMLMTAIGLMPEYRFDAIIVDEGQDFRPEWLVPLELCLQDPTDSLLYVFYDDNQRLNEGHGSFAGSIPQNPFRLTRNLRNTKHIFLAARPFYQSLGTRPAGPEGGEVEYVELRPGQSKLDAVSRAVERMIHQEHIAVEDLAVLTGRSVESSQLLKDDRLANLRTTRAGVTVAGRLVVDTVRRFKGLERPVVILVDIDAMVNDLELLYVGLTRPRSHLLVIGNHQDLDIIRRAQR
jgi:hypothetical protein